MKQLDSSMYKAPKVPKWIEHTTEDTQANLPLAIIKA